MFTKQKEIDDYIKDNGLFLSEDKLYMKTGEFDWININDRRERIIQHIRNNTSPLTDLAVTFPSISLSVFSNYNNREESIANHLVLIDEIKKSQKKFLNNKDWRLIELKTPYRKSNDSIKYLIYDIVKKDYNPIKESFLSDKDLKSAFEVVNLSVIDKLINDKLINRYDKAYEIELKRFGEIGVYNQDG